MNQTSTLQKNLLLALAGLFGLLAVAAGAFGSHALAARFTPRQMEIWEIANLYHLVHSVALFGVALLRDRFPGKLTLAAGLCFSAGILLFGGSLYAIPLSGLRSLGMVAPVGGLLLMAGWGCLIALGLRNRPTSP